MLGTNNLTAPVAHDLSYTYHQILHVLQDFVSDFVADRAEVRTRTQASEASVLKREEGSWLDASTYEPAYRAGEAPADEDDWRKPLQENGYIAHREQWL